MAKRTVKARRERKMRGGAVPTTVDEITNETTPNEIAQYLITLDVFTPSASINAPAKLLIDDIEQKLTSLSLDAKKQFVRQLIDIPTPVSIDYFKSKLNNAVKSSSAATSVTPSSSSAVPTNPFGTSSSSSASVPTSSTNPFEVNYVRPPPSPKPLKNILTSGLTSPTTSSAPPPSEITYKCTRTSGGRRRKSKKRSKKSKVKTRRH
jgi:hypothetical protein